MKLELDGKVVESVDGVLVFESTGKLLTEEEEKTLQDKVKADSDEALNAFKLDMEGLVEKHDVAIMASVMFRKVGASAVFPFGTQGVIEEMGLAKAIERTF